MGPTAIAVLVGMMIAESVGRLRKGAEPDVWFSLIYGLCLIHCVNPLPAQHHQSFILDEIIQYVSLIVMCNGPSEVGR